MLVSRSVSSCTTSVGTGAIGTYGSVVAPSSVVAYGAVPSTGTASGIVVPSTCVSVITSHTTSVPGAMLMVKFRQPSHEFTFGVSTTFISYPLVLTPVV
jgi:hypothetical protein